jgi:hypothetical protein
MDGADALRYILQNNIEGDLVECGVEHGKFESIWIHELLHHQQERDIWLFDTFEGLTEPGEFDYSCEGARYAASRAEVWNTWKENQTTSGQNTWCYCSLEEVKRNLFSTGYPVDKLHFVKGDVMVTLTLDHLPEKIAILRLDTDWYESSLFELEKLYDRVVEGGIIIFDDYFQWNGQRKATDDFLATTGIDYHVAPIGNGSTGSIVKHHLPSTSTLSV